MPAAQQLERTAGADLTRNHSSASSRPNSLQSSSPMELNRLHRDWKTHFQIAAVRSSDMSLILRATNSGLSMDQAMPESDSTPACCHRCPIRSVNFIQYGGENEHAKFICDKQSEARLGGQSHELARLRQGLQT
jgi:hypothetical protein